MYASGDLRYSRAHVRLASSAGLRLGLYVDAFNVYYGGRALCGRNAAGWKWLDIPSLVLDLIDPNLWRDVRLERFAYCTAPRGRRSRRSADQDAYIDALRHKYPGIAVQWGSYVRRTKSGVLLDGSVPPERVTSPGRANVPPWLACREIPANQRNRSELLVKISAYEEKGSDVNVASQMLIDVLSNSVDAAVVLSNDSDLQFPIQEARKRVPVGTVNPSGSDTPKALQGDSSSGAGRHWWRRLTSGDFYKHQLPDPCGPTGMPSDW